MKFAKKVVALLLCGALAFSMVPAAAFAAPGGSGTTYTYSVTLQENMVDGQDTEEADSERFDTTQVTLTVTDGLITDMTSTGVTSRNERYDSSAMSGILSQLTAITSPGTYDISTVSGATYSSKGIIVAVQTMLDRWETASGLTFKIDSTASYNTASGSTFTITVSDTLASGESLADYSNAFTFKDATGETATGISVVKDAVVTTADDEESSEATQVKETYTATISGAANTLGATYTVGVTLPEGVTGDEDTDYSNLGTVAIISAATVEIGEIEGGYGLTFTTGNGGETLAQYLSAITQIDVGVVTTVQQGPTTSTTTTTTSYAIGSGDGQYDLAYFFDETGAMHFSADAADDSEVTVASDEDYDNSEIFANGSAGNYTITIYAANFADASGSVGDGTASSSGSDEGPGDSDEGPNSGNSGDSSSESPSGTYTISVPSCIADGTYTSEAMPTGADSRFTSYYVTVTITVEGGAITGYSYTYTSTSSKDQQYCSRAATALTNIVSGGSGEFTVDTVSGATYSSYGFITAVQNILENVECNCGSRCSCTCCNCSNSGLSSLTTFVFDDNGTETADDDTVTVYVPEEGDSNYKIEYVTLADLSSSDVDSSTLKTYTELEDGGLQYSNTETTRVVVGIQKAGGEYVFEGTAADMAIEVKKQATSPATLYLNGLDLTSSYTSPLTIKKNSSSTVEVVAQAGKVNTLTDAALNNADTYGDTADGGSGANYLAESAVIKGKASAQLTLSGTGTLNLVANAKNGIKVGESGSLTIQELTLNVTSVKHGISSDNTLDIQSGNITVYSGGATDAATCVGSANGGDAIRSDPDTVEEGTTSGDITVEGGSITIVSASDGFQAANNITITGGSFDIQCGAGADDTTFDKDTMSCKGIKASAPDDATTVANTITISAGAFNINSADDAVHSDSHIFITGGTFELATTDDGVHADTWLQLGTEGGADADGPSITVSDSYEGLEAGTIYIYSGVYNVTSSDDGINAAQSTDSTSTVSVAAVSSNKGDNDFNFGGTSTPGSGQNSSSSTGLIYAYGGTVFVNAEGDGYDSNGSLYFYGGTHTVYGQAAGGSNDPLDCDDTLCINGATVFAAGSVQDTPSLSDSQTAVTYPSSSTSSSTPGGKSVGSSSSTGTTIAAGTTIYIVDGSDNVVTTFETPKDINYALYSSPSTTSDYSITTTAPEGYMAAEVVCSVGETQYTSLADGISAAAEVNGTVVLLADLEDVSETITGTLTLDLNGYSLTAGASDSIVLTANPSDSNADDVVTICDSSEEGTGAIIGGRVGVFVSRGTVVMNGGTITGVGEDYSYTKLTTAAGGVRVRSTGAFVMNGGTITGNKLAGVFVHSGKFTYTGGTIENNTLTISVSGTITLTDQACDIFVGSGATINVEAEGISLLDADGNAVSEPETYSCYFLGATPEVTYDYTVSIPTDMADGTYTGSALTSPDADEDFDAYYITVSIVVDGGVITSVSLTYFGGTTDDADYYKDASALIESLLNTTGDVGVDAVSGATCSSAALVEAISNAIAAATSGDDDDQSGTDPENPGTGDEGTGSDTGSGDEGTGDDQSGTDPENPGSGDDDQSGTDPENPGTGDEGTGNDDEQSGTEPENPSTGDEGTGSDTGSGSGDQGTGDEDQSSTDPETPSTGETEQPGDTETPSTGSEENQDGDSQAGSNDSEEDEPTAVVLKVSGKSKTLKAKALKKAKKSFKLSVKVNGKKVSFTAKKLSGGSKKLKVSKTGKITVKKGTKKGTYTCKVKVTVGSATQTIKVKVKVK